MSDETGGTIGIWIPEGSDVVERFERIVCEDDSRTSQILEAMEILIEVERALDDADYDMDDRTRRIWVRQAVHDFIRAEQADDSDDV